MRELGICWQGGKGAGKRNNWTNQLQAPADTAPVKEPSMFEKIAEAFRKKQEEQITDRLTMAFTRVMDPEATDNKPKTPDKAVAFDPQSPRIHVQSMVERFEEFQKFKEMSDTESQKELNRASHLLEAQGMEITPVRTPTASNTEPHFAQKAFGGTVAGIGQLMYRSICLISHDRCSLVTTFLAP